MNILTCCDADYLYVVIDSELKLLSNVDAVENSLILIKSCSSVFNLFAHAISSRTTSTLSTGNLEVAVSVSHVTKWRHGCYNASSAWCRRRTHNAASSALVSAIAWRQQLVVLEAYDALSPFSAGFVRLRCHNDFRKLESNAATSPVVVVTVAVGDAGFALRNGRQCCGRWRYPVGCKYNYSCFVNTRKAVSLYHLIHCSQRHG